MLSELFVDYIKESIRLNWDITALADYKGESFTYAEVAEHINNIHQLYHQLGISEGDKIALVSRNSARWGIVYLATVSYGAVIVPILPDFKPDDMVELINHSDSVLLFCSDIIFETLDKNRLQHIRGIISANSFLPVFSKDTTFDKTVKKNLGSGNKSTLTADNFTLPVIPNDRLAVISYTSGTTGHSKGVMLSHNSLTANIRFAQNNMPLNSGDPIVSFLPLAHTYGCAFEFLFPFTIGCTITILSKSPSPQVIMKAFQEIKPALILSVPLVIEKIFKKQILPVIEKPLMKILLGIPLVNRLILNKIRNKVQSVFGGNFTEIVIGGAAFSPQAETFFRKLKLPITVGYGMTECGPLISYASSKTVPFSSSGKAVDTLDVVVDSEDPQKKVGEILVRGENVMQGYYKNAEATKEIIDKNGWLHTGDLGVIDDGGYIYIKGRSKSLILGSNGKNIYPEEYESALNNCYCVLESLVVQRDEKLVALIYPDYDTMEIDRTKKEELPHIFSNNLKRLNQGFPKYMHVANYEIVEEEFLKTPKRSIRRYLYQ